MEPSQHERADVTISTFRTQVRRLTTAVASLNASLERATNIKPDNPQTLDLGALAARLETITPSLLWMTDDIRDKALAAFGRSPAGDKGTPTTIHDLRNSLNGVTIHAMILKELLAKLEKVKAGREGIVPQADLDMLDAELNALGHELNAWTMELGAILATRGVEGG
jgi:hypothetical protein